jgi:hypothetical protein
VKLTNDPDRHVRILGFAQHPSFPSKCLQLHFVHAPYPAVIDLLNKLTRGSIRVAAVDVDANQEKCPLEETTPALKQIMLEDLLNFHL